jgi:hypothetical protein
MIEGVVHIQFQSGRAARTHSSGYRANLRKGWVKMLGLSRLLKYDKDRAINTEVCTRDRKKGETVQIHPAVSRPADINSHKFYLSVLWT